MLRAITSMVPCSSTWNDHMSTSRSEPLYGIRRHSGKLQQNASATRQHGKCKLRS